MSTLYRKYRPQAWSEVAGQNHVKVTLAFEIATGKIAHAYLFSGPRGVGKTTAARIFSRAVNCLERKDRSPQDGDAGEPCGKCEACLSILEGRSLDVIEIDAASHRGIDAVRENIIENARFSPARLAKKVFIIDEVHMLTTEAFNALLKTLEEPPAHVVFILATTELHKVPQTILSRCQRFDFRKIPFTDLIERLHALAEREKVKVDRRTLEEIARQSDGSLRDAEGLLGKVLTMGDGKRVTYDEALVVLPRSDAEALASFVDALLHKDARSAILTVGDCLEGGVDLDQFANDAVELLRKTMLTGMSGNPDVFSAELDEEGKKRLEGWAALAPTAELVVAIETLMEKRREIKTSHPAQLPLELAVVRICEGLPARASSDELRASSLPIAKTGPVTSSQLKAQSSKLPTPAAAVAEAVAEAVAAKEAELTATVEAPALAPLTAEDRKAEAAAQVIEAVTTVEVVQARWKEFMAKAGEQNHGLLYLLGVGSPVAVAGRIVKIGFDFAFHRDKLMQEKNRRMIEKALAAVVGTDDIRVEGVLLEKKEGLVQDNAAPAQDVLAAQPVPVIEGNLLQAFGGRVVE
ncbi:MAG TPA: DNA polymerase III subunit gamma/tau [Candidatus Binatia bacterium]|nr:DNA polymerase III subunit gamma/tau [Candidatus Binatia bacterium]